MTSEIKNGREKGTNVIIIVRRELVGTSWTESRRTTVAYHFCNKQELLVIINEVVYLIINK